MNACNNDITVDFIANGSSTIIKFEHFHFNKHGEGADEYLKAMDSKQGWDHILGLYKTYCGKSK